MKPAVRKEGLILRRIGDELLVYDRRSHEAHCLDAAAAAVFSACDGTRSVRELTARLRRELARPVDGDWVRLALGQLERAGLLEEPLPGPVPMRRDVMRRVAQAALLPAVVSIVSPTPLMAATAGNYPIGHTCTASNQCASGCCHKNQLVCKATGSGSCL
jgi:PqqD family protein of HPr-rel-A system